MPWLNAVPDEPISEALLVIRIGALRPTVFPVESASMPVPSTAKVSLMFPAAALVTVIDPRPALKARMPLSPVTPWLAVTTTGPPAAMASMPSSIWEVTLPLAVTVTELAKSRPPL